MSGHLGFINQYAYMALNHKMERSGVLEVCILGKIDSNFKYQSYR